MKILPARFLSAFALLSVALIHGNARATTLVTATGDGTVSTAYWVDQGEPMLGQWADLTFSPNPFSYSNVTNTIEVTFAAPAGQQFAITPLAADSSNTTWNIEAHFSGPIGSLQFNGIPSVHFAGLTGVAPEMDTSMGYLR